MHPSVLGVVCVFFGNSKVISHREWWGKTGGWDKARQGETGGQDRVRQEGETGGDKVRQGKARQEGKTRWDRVRQEGKTGRDKRARQGKTGWLVWVNFQDYVPIEDNGPFQAHTSRLPTKGTYPHHTHTHGCEYKPMWVWIWVRLRIPMPLPSHSLLVLGLFILWGISRPHLSWW